MYRNKPCLNSYKRYAMYILWINIGYTNYGIYTIYTLYIRTSKKYHRDQHADGVIIPGMSTGTLFKRIDLIYT